MDIVNTAMMMISEITQAGNLEAGALASTRRQLRSVPFDGVNAQSLCDPW